MDCANLPRSAPILSHPSTLRLSINLRYLPSRTLLYFEAHAQSVAASSTGNLVQHSAAAVAKRAGRVVRQ